MYIQISSNEQEEAIKSKYDYVVLFLTSMSCPKCNSCKDEIINIYNDNPEVMLAVSEVSRQGFNNDKYQLRSVPTFIFYFDGDEIGRLSTSNVSKITDMIDGILQKIKEVRTTQVRQILR